MAGESNMNTFLMQMNTTIDYYFMIVILWQSEKQKGSNDSLRNSETQKKVKLLCRFIHTWSNTCSYVCRIIKIFARRIFIFISASSRPNWATWKEL
jgi:hypothetical protein